MGQPQQPDEPEAAKPPLRVGMVGYAFMGAAHSQGWRTAGRAFDLPLRPVLSVICGRDAEAVRRAADRHGWAMLQRARPQVDWNKSSLRRADLTGDGKLARVMMGHDDERQHTQQAEDDPQDEFVPG